MAQQLSSVTRQRYSAAYIAAFPAAAVLSIRTGAPAGVGNAVGGTQLVAITLPATPLTSAAGVVSLSGTWSNAAATAGTAAHYRMTNSTDIEEGTVTGVSGGGDLELSNTNIAVSQVVTISTWTRNMPAA